MGSIWGGLSSAAGGSVEQGMALVTPSVSGDTSVSALEFPGQSQNNNPARRRLGAQVADDTPRRLCAPCPGRAVGGGL